MATFTLRIEDDLYKKLTKLASEEGRSINSQIVQLIKEKVK